MPRKEKKLPEEKKKKLKEKKMSPRQIAKHEKHYGLKQAFSDLRAANTNSAKIEIIEEILADLIDELGMRL